MSIQITISELYSLEHTLAKPYLEQFTYPWEALAGIGDFVRTLGKTLRPEEYDEIAPEVWVAKSATVAPTATIKPPCVIGPETEVRPGADSILGFKAHMGAGSITSNVKSDKTLVVVKSPDGRQFETGRKKFGAMLGDSVEVGCNSVLNPGTVIGRESNIYPLSCVRGVVPAGHIFKAPGNVVAKR